MCACICAQKTFNYHQWRTLVRLNKNENDYELTQMEKNQNPNMYLWKLTNDNG